MWPHFINLSHRVWEALVSASGTSTFGIFLFSIAIPFVTAVLTAVIEWKKKSTGDVIRDSVKAGGTVLIALVVVLGAFYLGFFVPTIYGDHQSLVGEVKKFKDMADPVKIKELEDEAKIAKDDARRFQKSYDGLAKGDLVPDRILTVEEKAILDSALRKFAEKPENKKRIYLKIGAIQADKDRESHHLAFDNLYVIASQTPWKVQWLNELPPQIRAKNPLPIGIVILTDDPMWLGVFLRDNFQNVGLGKVDVNPYGPMPSDFKGTIVWVGYKTWP